MKAQLCYELGDIDKDQLAPHNRGPTNFETRSCHGWFVVYAQVKLFSGFYTFLRFTQNHAINPSRNAWGSVKMGTMLGQDD